MWITVQQKKNTIRFMLKIAKKKERKTYVDVIQLFDGTHKMRSRRNITNARCCEAQSTLSVRIKHHGFDACPTIEINCKYNFNQTTKMFLKKSHLSQMHLNQNLITFFFVHSPSSCGDLKQ